MNEARTNTLGFDSLSDDHLLQVDDVTKLVPLHRATVYRWASEGHFPKAKALGPRRVAWRLGDIREWIRNRPDSATEGRTVKARAARGAGA
jgi:predicted DNA-binding transcriptional regulator AlpA